MSEFNIRKYQNENSTLVDGSDALANQRELVISFYHVPSERVVKFKAFITTFNETYNSNFTPNETFGRTDPIYQYKSTTRKITLGFKVPAASEGEAYENLGRVSALEQMLYPTYSELNSATTLSQAPLMRVKVMNLLSSDFNSSQIRRKSEVADEIITGRREPRQGLFTVYKSTSNPKQGLLGVIDNLTVNHNLEGEDGVFFKRREVENSETGRRYAESVPNTILPKFIDISLSFSPIHEETIGWKQDKTAMNSLFPYGASTDQSNPEILNKFQKNYDTYNEQQAKQKAENEKRKLRQQNLENAKARYSGVLGNLRMKADVRRGAEGDEAAKARLSARSEILREDMQARFELTRAAVNGDQFIGESGD
jgi:hypothetical protein